jgi:hypothetical protein
MAGNIPAQSFCSNVSLSFSSGQLTLLGRMLHEGRFDHMTSSHHLFLASADTTVPAKSAN